MPRLTIPRDALPGFIALRSVGPDKLADLATKVPPVLLRPKDFEELVANYAGGAEAVVAGTLRSLAMLALNQSAAEVLDEVTRTLTDQARWTVEELHVWKGLQPALARLLESPGLVALAKVIQLQYDHTNILTDTHVITDVRPVFDRDATKPIAAVICHTIRISYHDKGEHRHLALALDTADLERLVRDAKRALQKAEVMNRYLQSPTALPTRIAGNEDGT